MDPTTTTSPPTTDSAGVVPAVDPFLVEALQNPRHRLTILRMELDMQNFIRNSDQQQFEFQHFPTSYLRLAAHRVAQHYGLVTMVQDKCLDGQGTIIVVKKMAPSKYPAVCLSEVPVKQSESDKLEQKKIVIRPRPSKESSNGGSELGKRNSIRTVEERKEEYERARARIFSGPNSPQSEDPASQAPVGGNTVCYNVDDSIGTEDSVMDLEKNFSGRDGGSSSRVAILRDIEKDRTDPDYDRSYERYVRSLPSTQHANLMPFNMQKFQPPYQQFDSTFPHFGHVPAIQASLGYRGPVMNPYPAIRMTQMSRDAVYMHWPSHAMVQAHSYDHQLRHAVFQAPFCQQPLSFDYSHNY